MKKVLKTPFDTALAEFNGTGSEEVTAKVMLEDTSVCPASGCGQKMTKKVVPTHCGKQEVWVCMRHRVVLPIAEDKT